ncbi:MAG: M48 family metallopeptidase [Ignavibacteria bacterium]|nr:M48 family metallopeptidase [Ignavibacteria bacterium]MBI3765434.1 M48 family metallopeptidase [Ignavibacteriales bacterium]
MNLYAAIILTTLLVEYVLNLVADLLNMRTLGTALPNEFEGVVTEDVYQKSQEYTRVRTTYGIIVSTFNTIVTIAFWFLGGFNGLDQIVRGWHLGTLWTGLLYIGILMLVRSILTLPFHIYSTFVIEERFGFNKTTPATFVTDLLKGLLLAVVLGGPLLLGILILFEYTGGLAWLYGWIAATLFALIVQFIAPTWIMPLFNKFTPLEGGELRDAIVAYAESVQFSLRDIFMMDGSKRSSKTNAFFTGFGKHKRIALFDTLMKNHTVQELVAVLAHEIGHYKKKHILTRMIISILHIGVMLFLLSIFVSKPALAGKQNLFDAFFMKQASIYAGVVFFGLLFAPLEFLLSLLMHVISRKNEFEADRFAAETFGHPEAMIAALKKLSVENLSHLTPHPFYVSLNYSHPPVAQRIRAIRDLTQGSA